MELLLPIVVLSAFIQPAHLLSQAAIDKIAYDMRVYAEVVENKKDYSGSTHTVRITLGNYELEPIPCCEWVLYFHSFFILFPGETVNDFPHTSEKILPDQKIIVRMIGGDLYSLEPMYGFGNIVKDQWKYITLTVKYWSVSISDFMPNWYISQKTEVTGVWPAILSDTMSLSYVKPFYYPYQWKRYPEDRYDPVSPEVRNSRLGTPDQRQLPPAKLVIPTPVRLRHDKSKKMLAVDASWRIRTTTRGNAEIAKFLSEKIYVRQTYGRKKNKVIILKKGNIGSERESYKIKVDAANEIVTVTGKDDVGLFYGVQSVISLIDSHYGMAISDVEIHDYPRFPYRGFLLDVARNFHPVADVKRIIRAMAKYKLNKLVLHLADDEGWRVPILGLPELTDIGGKRCHDLNETECILPQYGSGPFEDTSGTGSYTEQEYKEILAYAQKHFIEVIPEIDAPGHAHAAIRAMEVRSERERENEFRLVDPLDKSFHMSVQHWFDNVMNPCMGSTYTFLHRVLTRIIRLHRSVQPLRTFSIRGDEVPEGVWIKSPKCNRLLRKFPKYKKPKGLKRYFAEKMAAMTKREGLRLQVCEDLLFDDKNRPFKLKKFNNNIMVVARRNIWELGQAAQAYRLANNGYKVILSMATHLYFDQPYEPSSLEPGLYWATRFSDTRKVFSLKPDELYDNIDLSRAGEPLTYAKVCGPGGRRCDKLRKNKRKNIIGMQAHLWSELMRTGERLDYMAFPRGIAFAEVAWSKRKFEYKYLPAEKRRELEQTDWIDFANTVGYKELWRLDNMDIKYRIPPPGAVTYNNYVYPSVEFPGLITQYSYDDYDADHKTWKDVDKAFWRGNGTVLLRTKSPHGNRYSRVVYLT